MIKNLNISISGRVQGVFYRATAMEKATNLGIKGFARNERDGSVYMEAEGEEESLVEFIDWCYIGPPGARVDKVVKKEGIMKNYSSFVIYR
jgi:acylphosphatase